MSVAAISLALLLRGGAVGAAEVPTEQVSTMTMAMAKEARPQLLPYVEVVTGGASPDEPLPLVIVLHGRGGSPEKFVERFGHWPGQARVVVLGGPFRAGRGRAWFSTPMRTMGDDELDAELEARVASVAETVRQIRETYPTRGQTVLAGYSQGATVALAVALRHPEVADDVVVASSWLPGRWIPEDAVSGTRIHMTHGVRDRRLPLRDAESVRGKLAASGYEVRLRPVATAEHRLKGRAHGVFLSHLRVAVDRPRSAT